MSEHQDLSSGVGPSIPMSIDSRESSHPASISRLSDFRSDLTFGADPVPLIWRIGSEAKISLISNLISQTSSIAHRLISHPVFIQDRLRIPVASFNLSVLPRNIFGSIINIRKFDSSRASSRPSHSQEFLSLRQVFRTPSHSQYQPVSALSLYLPECTLSIFLT